MKIALQASLALLAVAVAAPASADVIHVPLDANTIQAGVDMAQAGDTVIVANGIWTGKGNRDVVIPGYDIVVRSANGPANCIIDSQGLETETHRAFYLDGANTRATVIEGFTITGGETLPGAVQDQFNAGGILIRSGSPTIRGCTLEGNNCSCWGGALCSSSAGMPRVTQCMFRNNHSDAEGGALFQWGLGELHVDNSVFIGNSSTQGGALFSFGTVVLDHVTVTDNHATWGAGSAYLQTSQITNSIFWGNTSQQAGAEQLDAWNSTVAFSLVEGGHAGTNIMDANPRFRADGWRLRGYVSPCVNAGVPGMRGYRHAVDFLGNRRRSALRVDMGAHEVPIGIAYSR